MLTAITRALLLHFGLFSEASINKKYFDRLAWSHFILIALSFFERHRRILLAAIYFSVAVRSCRYWDRHLVKT